MRKLTLILAGLVLLCACREPRSVERFVKGPGPFVFSVDMSDTTVVYDLDFYTRVDVPWLWGNHRIPAETVLDIVWTAPSDSTFREKVYLPLGAKVYQPYRAGVSPREPGVWTLTVWVPQPPEGLRGMGLVTKNRSPWDTEN